MGFQNPQYASNANYGPLSGGRKQEEEEEFGAGMNGNSIKAVGGGFKEKNTGKMILKTGAQIAGTIYGGPAGGMAAGVAVDMAVPDKQSVKTGTSGFGNPQGGGSQMSSQRGGNSDPSGALVVAGAQAYDKYKAGQQAAGPLTDQATQMALEENAADVASNAYTPATDATANAATDAAADGAGDTAADGLGNTAMYAKAAYDISNKLNESGVMESENPGESKFTMDASTIGSGNKPIKLGGTPTTTAPGPLASANKPKFDQEEYMRRFGGYNYG